MTEVDILSIQESAIIVRKANLEMAQRMEESRKKMDQYLGMWTGKCGQNAVGIFYNICRDQPSRAYAIENVARALDAITNGYLEVENVNIRLSDQFR